MPQDKDYQNFVARMGSFEDNFDDLFGGKETEQTLEHHGILGMHWGVKHISAAKTSADASANIVKEAKNIHSSVSDVKAVKKIPNMENMTNAQLKEQVTRMNLEQQYANLTANQLSKGRNYTNSILEVGGSALAITSSALGIALAIKQLKG